MIGEYSNKHLDLLAKLTPLDRIMCWCWNWQIKGLILPLKLVTYWNPSCKNYGKCRTCINLLPLLCLREGFLISRQYYKYISNMTTALNETDQMVTTPAPCSNPGVCKCYSVSLIPSSGFPACDTNGVSQHSNLSVLTVELWVSLNYNIFSIFPISQLIFFPSGFVQTNFSVSTEKGFLHGNWKPKYEVPRNRTRAAVASWREELDLSSLLEVRQQH